MMFVTKKDKERFGPINFEAEQLRAFINKKLIIENGIKDVVFTLEWSKNFMQLVIHSDLKRPFCCKEYNDKCFRRGYKYHITLNLTTEPELYPLYLYHKNIIDGKKFKIHVSRVSDGWTVYLNMEKLDDRLKSAIDDLSRGFFYTKPHISM